MGNYQEYLKQVPSPLQQLYPDQPQRLHTFGNPYKLDKKEDTNDSTIDDVVENHVVDHLSPDVTPNAVGADFSASSAASSLERPANHTEALSHDHLGTDDLSVGGFLEKHEEPRDKKQCSEENVPVSSLNKGRKLVHCRSHEEVNTELKSQIMKEI
ncbi:Integrator complex subunit 6 [Manis javanica]|nr:Integrator complex subunit 6 [Manis javanica]